MDELPQLFNMLLGDMAFIGPRPLYMTQAEEWDDRQRRRLEVRPGLTGLAQVSGRGGLTIEEKLELDVQFVERAGIGLYLKLLADTITRLGRSEDIYEVRYSRDHQRRPIPPASAR